MKFSSIFKVNPLWGKVIIIFELFVECKCSHRLVHADLISRPGELTSPCAVFWCTISIKQEWIIGCCYTYMPSLMACLMVYMYMYPSSVHKHSLVMMSSLFRLHFNEIHIGIHYQHTCSLNKFSILCPIVLVCYHFLLIALPTSFVVLFQWT